MSICKRSVEALPLPGYWETAGVDKVAEERVRSTLIGAAVRSPDGRCGVVDDAWIARKIKDQPIGPGTWYVDLIYGKDVIPSGYFIDHEIFRLAR